MHRVGWIVVLKLKVHVDYISKYAAIESPAAGVDAVGIFVNFAGDGMKITHWFSSKKVGCKQAVRPWHEFGELHTADAKIAQCTQMLGNLVRLTHEAGEVAVSKR